MNDKKVMQFIVGFILNWVGGAIILQELYIYHRPMQLMLGMISFGLGLEYIRGGFKR